MFDDSQLLKLLAAIEKLKDNSHTVEHLLTTAFPAFIGTFLGFLFGQFTELLRNRRENRKTETEREENELSQLNVISSALWFNLEQVLHLVLQQLLPHHIASHDAMTEFQSAMTSEHNVKQLAASISDRFPAMTMRCPQPTLIDLDLFKTIPFALEVDPELLKLSGWVTSYGKDLHAIIDVRNTQIDLIPKANLSGGLDLGNIQEQIRVHAHLSQVECINSFMYLKMICNVLTKIEKITGRYSHLNKIRLKGSFPDIFNKTMQELETIAKEHPDYTPDEQENKPA